MFENKCTYNDFLKSQEGIATNILASRLKQLEENGIIEKSAHPDSKAKNLYRLTSKGIDLLPILIEVYIWSDKYFTIPADVKVVIQEAKKDKEKFENQIRSILTTLLEMQKASHS
jgi:DNA-binding HxlR family transcriptional regulator